MDLKKSEVEHIARLAKIKMTNRDLDDFSKQLSQILKEFQILANVDTSNVLATSHTMGLTSVFREDEACISLSKEDVLANAPREDEGFFRVKPVLR